jgi:hypothetical protein
VLRWSCTHSTRVVLGYGELVGKGGGGQRRDGGGVLGGLGGLSEPSGALY